MMHHDAIHVGLPALFYGTRGNTLGNSYKFINQRFRYDIRKYYLISTIINISGIVWFCCNSWFSQHAHLPFD